jgi:catechol 2,3-dioxygenase-like lactoylglutathione lyase family enzyme
MNTRKWAKALCALGLCGLIGCGSDSQGARPVSGSGGAAAAGGAQAMGAAPGINGGAAVGGGAGTGATSAVGGITSAGGGMAATGGAASAGGGAAAGGTVSAGGAVSAAGASASGGSSGATASGGGGGAAGTPDPHDIPTPVSAPLIWGFGIGITDVPAAVKFYTGAMKMTVEKDAVKRDDRTETTLYGVQAMRGARLVLMKFDDMRNTQKITTKLVWQAQNAAAVNTAASMYPGYVSRLNIGIVQFDGPETYIQEVGSIFDSGGSAISVPYPIAMGFAVSDQPASRKFYTSLGTTETSLGSFSVTDVSGTGNIAEYSVKFTDGMGAVLQQWTPMRNAKDNPVKLVIFVPDAKAMADKVTAAGGTIVKQAERSAAYDNRLLVVARDLDGYVLEIVE